MNPIKLSVEIIYNPLLHLAEELISMNSYETILEIGCGEKSHVSRMKLKSATCVIALDIAYENLLLLKSCRQNCLLVNADANHLPLKPHSFDLIYSCSVFQYINWQQLVYDIKKCLKHRGQVILIENLQGNLFARAYRLFHKALKWSYRKFEVPTKHLQVNKINEITKLFYHNKIYFFYVFTPAILILPLLLERLRIVKVGYPSTVLFKILFKIDQYIIKHITYSKYICWHTVIYLTK